VVARSSDGTVPRTAAGSDGRAGGTGEPGAAGGGAEALTSGETSDLQTLAGAPIARLTTIGRRTKHPRTVELWFAYHEGRIYLLGHPESNWVRNVAANPRVTLAIDEITFEGAARIVDSARSQVYQLFQNKYGTEQISYWYGAERAQRRTIEIVLRLAAH